MPDEEELRSIRLDIASIKEDLKGRPGVYAGVYDRLKVVEEKVALLERQTGGVTEIPTLKTQVNANTSDISAHKIYVKIAVWAIGVLTVIISGVVVTLLSQIVTGG